MPNIFIIPSVLLVIELIMPIVEDLPAPLGPSKAKKSPLVIFRSMPFRASCNSFFYVKRFF